MNRLLKLAWYQLIVMILWTAAMGITAALILYKNLNGELITIPLLLGIFIRFDRVFFRKKPGRIEFDERDAVIQQRALNIAFTVFYYTFIVGSMIAYFAIGPRTMIQAGVFVIMILASVILLRMGWAVAVIVLYGIGSGKKPETLSTQSC